MIGPDETLDAIGEGRLRLVQRRDGYRFNLDAVLLAAFAVDGREAERPIDVVDFGTGCGVVALLVAAWRPRWRVQAVERQASLAGLARRNAELNALPVEILERDWRELRLESPVDLVVSNPPWFDVSSGRPPPDEEKAAARHELNGDVDDLARAMKRSVRSNGACCVVFPASRLVRLLAAFEGAGLAATRLRFVHPRVGEEAGSVLLEARPASKRPLVVEPPLVVHEGDGFGPEVRRMVSRDGC